MTDMDSPMATVKSRVQRAYPQSSPTPARERPVSAASDAWEVLSESGASLISPERRVVDEDSLRSWKSAGNGTALSDFGGECHQKGMTHKVE